VEYHQRRSAAFDEKAPGFLDQIMGHRPQVFPDILEAVVCEVARKGEGVISGGFFENHPGTDDRIQRIQALP
jgi:hypothetical protein